MNKEDQSAYWYHRYSLRPLLDAQGHVSLTPTGAAVHDVPLILAEAKDSILMTGKYLNAIRECGRQVVRPLPSDVHIGEALLTSCHSCDVHYCCWTTRDIRDVISFYPWALINEPKATAVSSNS